MRVHVDASVIPLHISGNVIATVYATLVLSFPEKETEILGCKRGANKNQYHNTSDEFTGREDMVWRVIELYGENNVVIYR